MDTKWTPDSGPLDIARGFEQRMLEAWIERDCLLSQLRGDVELPDGYWFRSEYDDKISSLMIPGSDNPLLSAGNCEKHLKTLRAIAWAHYHSTTAESDKP
jgi:hypothetical protein